MPEQPSDLDSLKVKLARIFAEHRTVKSEPDERTREEKEDLEKQKRREEIRGLGQDINERKRYALCYFILACCWLGAITLILLLQGFGSFWFGLMPFKLQENVLLAVIGSTTVNVLGILYVVANYLFPKR